jgi:putative membrane protein
MKILLIPLAFIIALLSCVYPGGRHMMDWGHMNYGYGGAFMWIIFLVLIGIAIYFIINSKKLIKRDEDETPLEILKKRYAKGEITKQEFEKIKKDLE